MDIITLELLMSLGFAPAPKSPLPQLLSRINPTGGTALRDSIATGISLMLKLNEAL